MCFLLVGFFVGYLKTRLYLAGAFSQADRAVIEEEMDRWSAQGSEIRGMAEDAHQVAVKKPGDAAHPVLRRRSVAQ